MPEQWQLDDTQPIRPISREEKPATRQLPVTTDWRYEVDNTSMTIARALITQALTPLSPELDRRGRTWRQFAKFPAPMKPVREYENWHDIEPIGTNPVEWNPSLMLARLGIAQARWDSEGVAERFPRSHGYSLSRRIWLNPRAFSPVSVLLHEASHIILGHTSYRHQVTTPEGEVEAELSTFVLLNLIGAQMEATTAASRVYLHDHLKDVGELPDEATFRKVGSAALTIFHAGGA